MLFCTVLLQLGVCGLVCCMRVEMQYMFYAMCVFSYNNVTLDRKYAVFKTNVIWVPCTSIERVLCGALTDTQWERWELSLFQAVSFLSSMALSHGKGLHNSTGFPRAFRAFTAIETDSSYRLFQRCGSLLCPLPPVTKPSHPSPPLFFPPVSCVVVFFFFLTEC